jgi:hypothetical protein
MQGENCLSLAWVQLSLQTKEYKCIIQLMLIITAWQHISPEGIVMVLYLYNEPTATLFNASTKNIS